MSYRNSVLIERALSQLIADPIADRPSASEGFAQPVYPTESAVIVWNASAAVIRDLSHSGYTQTHRFAVLPSCKNPRWLIPHLEGHTPANGFQIYMPYARSARILKALVVRLMSTGWLDWAPNTVSIGSRGPLALETLVREVTGESQPVFTLSLGSQTPFRKLVVQVMRGEGDILGYIKLPLSETATVRVRHEAEVLKALWNFPMLRPRIPKVLYEGEWKNGFLLFQSNGPSGRGPLKISSLHEKFFQALRSSRGVDRPARTIIGEVAARWRKVEALLNPALRTLGAAALVMAEEDLEGSMVPCGIGHGDFTPWNTRVGSGYLYVFDWESAVWDAPIDWDVFHFHVQTGCLLSKANSFAFPWDRHATSRSCFLLYLLSSIAQLVEENANQIGIRYRQKLLAGELGSKPYKVLSFERQIL